jgi:hypothetical protein
MGMAAYRREPPSTQLLDAPECQRSYWISVAQADLSIGNVPVGDTAAAGLSPRFDRAARGLAGEAWRSCLPLAPLRCRFWMLIRRKPKTQQAQRIALRTSVRVPHHKATLRKLVPTLARGLRMKSFVISTLFIAALWPAAAATAGELVIIVNPQNSATRMFPSQAAQFFLGSSAMFTPMEQAPNSSIRTDFCKKVLGKEPPEVRAIWSKLVFTGKGKPPKEFKSSAEVKKAVSENVDAIGYIDKSEVDDSVKVVASIP